MLLIAMIVHDIVEDSWRYILGGYYG